MGHRAQLPTSRQCEEGRRSGSDCLLSLFSNGDEAGLARIPSPWSPWPSLLVGEEEHQTGPDTICGQSVLQGHLGALPSYQTQGRAQQLIFPLLLEDNLEPTVAGTDPGVSRG